MIALLASSLRGHQEFQDPFVFRIGQDNWILIENQTDMVVVNGPTAY